MSLHFPAQTPWFILGPLAVAMLVLALWAYRFRVPPLPGPPRRLLPVLRALALLGLLALLAQPVLERANPAGRARVTVLLDRSASMVLPASPGGGARSEEAARAVRDVAQALRGRARVDVRAFAAALGRDSADVRGSDATALGDALGALAAGPIDQRADGVIVVSDGVVNAGSDPLAAAVALGAPVHGVLTGRPLPADRAVAGVEASARARVGEPTPIRVRVTSGEQRGTPIGVRLMEGGRERARATVLAPGSGAEALAELRVAPAKAGLAVWTVELDALTDDPAPMNDARQVAVLVDPGRLGVRIFSAGLHWDLSFLRRALIGDSALAVATRVRTPAGWQLLEAGRPGAPSPADLRDAAVVVLDGLAGADLGADFDAALAAFVRGGGGLFVLGGGPAGLSHAARGRLASDLAVTRSNAAPSSGAPPVPAPSAGDLLAWDDDPARGERAWRAAAPLSDAEPIVPGGADRVLVSAGSDGVPLLTLRRIGRGQALLVNGGGVWRWSLAGTDELAGERGARLWRRLVRTLAEPVQAEPLRLKPERWLSAAGERVKLFATLQDAEFRPVAGAELSGEVRDASGRSVPLTFEARSAGSFVATLDGLPPGRWRASARASRAGRDLGRAVTEFAIDRWSLEALRSEPDSASLAAIVDASGGSMTAASTVGAWARALPARALARTQTTSTRLWESPWLFAGIVLLLCVEWAWRRLRGLP